MDFEKIFKWLNIVTYGALVLAGLGLILLVVGLIASMIELDVVGVLFIAGAIFAVVYFYPEKAKYQRIKKAKEVILSKKCVTENELAIALSVTEKIARECIDICFRKGCVPGYIRKGQKIYHHEKYAEESSMAGKVIVAIDCHNCGANFKGVSGEPSQCPYCGSYINA
jgi:predicted Zn-ribbon and HTH transcriptional regulator